VYRIKQHQKPVVQQSPWGERTLVRTTNRIDSGPTDRNNDAVTVPHTCHGGGARRGNNLITSTLFVEPQTVGNSGKQIQMKDIQLSAVKQLLVCLGHAARVSATVYVSRPVTHFFVPWNLRQEQCHNFEGRPPPSS
jgi:hypothetical protein